VSLVQDRNTEFYSGNKVRVLFSLNLYCLFVCLFPWASAASHGCTAACWLIVPPALNVPTLATRTTRAYRRVPHSSGGSWNLWAGNKDREFYLNPDFHGTFRVLLHAANLRHGTHGFTSLPKESVLRILPPLKIRLLRPDLNPRTWVPEASTPTPRPPKPLNLYRYRIMTCWMTNIYLSFEKKYWCHLQGPVQNNTYTLMDFKRKKNGWICAT
jgi:hypothetical protein